LEPNLKCLNKEKKYSLNEFCENLSISVATGKNWLRLGKIIPSEMSNNKPVFYSEYIENFKQELLKGENTTLKTRRNKNFIYGSSIYNGYISETSENYSVIKNIIGIISANPDLLENLNLMLAECAIQLLIQCFGINSPQKTNLLKLYLEKKFTLTNYNKLIDDLIKDCSSKLEYICANPELFSIEYKYEQNEDILGLLYISCKNTGNRKENGAYYTPTNIVKILIKEIFDNNTSSKNKTLLEPCCGTGNFLLQLPEDFSLKNIHACDIDETSVQITRINLSLKYKSSDTTILYKQIQVCDYLKNKDTNFDYIIGNPPWGVLYSTEQKEIYKKTFKSAIGNNIEAYDLFLEHSLGKLTQNGVLSFVLPEAIMNVKSHQPIRELLIKSCLISYINYLGNTFDKVNCPSIIIQLKPNNGSPFTTIGTRVKCKKKEFLIDTDREISAKFMNFSIDNNEYKVLEKISKSTNYVYLKNNAEFALGIVTGNNNKYLTNSKSENNEIILKGSDISKYKIKEPSHYIKFDLKNFQQAAPEEFYRAKEKLIYRFISNQLVFAYDNSQILTLNSCNILIPQIKELDIKYIMAVLNSRIAQFIFAKTFQSVKVLRSHIEQIPIPKASPATKQKIINLVNKLLECTDRNEILKLYNNIDNEIKNLYNLNAAEYSIIKSTIGSNLLF